MKHELNIDAFAIALLLTIKYQSDNRRHIADYVQQAIQQSVDHIDD